MTKGQGEELRQELVEMFEASVAEIRQEQARQLQLLDTVGRNVLALVAEIKAVGNGRVRS